MAYQVDFLSAFDTDLLGLMAAGLTRREVQQAVLDSAAGLTLRIFAGPAGLVRALWSAAVSGGQ